MLEIDEAEFSVFAFLIGLALVQTDGLNKFENVGKLLEGIPLEGQHLVVGEKSRFRFVLELVSGKVASAVDDVDDADDDRRHRVDLTEDLFGHSSELLVEAELLDDGGGDAINASAGGDDVRKDGVVTDGVVLGREEAFRLAPDGQEAAFPLVELAGAVVQVSEV